MKRHLFFFFLLIFLTHNIHALGIAQEPLKDNTLKLYPGQQYSFKLIMQNSDSTPSEVNLTVTGDIVEIQDRQESYILPAKSYNNIVFLNITVPKDAKVNDTYELRYSMSPAKTNKTDPSIKIGMRISQPIHVKIIPEPAAEKDWTTLKNRIIGIIGFLILIIVFWRLALLVEKKMNKSY